MSYVNTDKPSRRPRSRSGNEMLNKTILFGVTDTALSHSHLDTLNSGHLGQPQKQFIPKLNKRVFGTFLRTTKLDLKSWYPSPVGVI